MATFERDQDAIKLGISLNSKRTGGVWGNERRQEQLTVRTAPVNEQERSNSSPGRMGKADEIRHKRREAARWITSLVGEQVPFATDREFRASLRNGVLLCRIMNEVAPGTIPVVYEDDDVNNTKQRFENVQRFMSAAISMGVPQEYMFSLPDVESDGTEERPRVSDCILWLKRLHGSSVPASPSPFGGAGDITQPSDSPRRSIHATVMKALQTSSASSLTQPQGVMRGSDHISAVQGISSLLKEKMAYNTAGNTRTGSSTSRTGSTYDSSTVSAMGPVLENVLCNLTQEYERRLLYKDQEIQGVRDKLASAQRDMEGMNHSLQHLRRELDSARQQAAVDALAGAQQQIEQYEAQVCELQAQLEAREQECAELRRLLSSQDGAVEEVRREYESQLEGVRERLTHVDQMTENYRVIQEENRRLYNTVQDLRGAIRVFCRIRPHGRTGDSSAVCVDVGSEQDLATYDPAPKPHSTHVGHRTYRFDRIFGEATTQQEIYADTQPLIRSVLDGYNVCIFAYGQTGSGKTHTMSGSHPMTTEQRGINYRALDDLFELRDRRSDEVHYDIQVQMLEIYNETLRDLLLDAVHSGSSRLEILNTQASGCNVPGATKITVRDTDDVMEMMARGSKNRHSAETKMNQRSSRSHQVLTVIVDGHNKLTGARTHGCLHLIDLAGSERTDKSQVTGDRMTEANYINTSLSALGSVMAALARKDRHVPFRDSKLTQLLADSLSGQAKVMMFMHISPEGSSYSETTSTLKFAERVSQITLGEAKRNVESGEVYKSHEENQRLRLQVEQQDSQLQQLEDALRQAQERVAVLEARAAQAETQQRNDLCTPMTDRTEYRSIASAPNTGESKPHSALTLNLSPVGSIQRPSGLPLPSPPSHTHTTPMQTIRENKVPPIPTSSLPRASLTPNSARSSGFFGSVSGAASSAARSATSKPPMSMREGGRYKMSGGVSPSTYGSSGSSGAMQGRPVSATPRTAAGAAQAAAPRSRPPAPAPPSARGDPMLRHSVDVRSSEVDTRASIDGSAGVSRSVQSLPRVASLGSSNSTTRGGAIPARPATAAGGVSSAASARQSSVYGRPASAAASSAATPRGSLIPASAGGRSKSGGTWQR